MKNELFESELKKAHESQKHAAQNLMRWVKSVQSLSDGDIPPTREEANKIYQMCIDINSKVQELQSSTNNIINVYYSFNMK